MRIPLPLVVFLSICLISGIWWYGARQHDFMRIPGEARLKDVRDRAKASFEVPKETIPEDLTPVQVKPPPPMMDPSPEVETSQINGDPAPTIQEYRDVAGKGAQYLIGMAVLLETGKDHQRALLAWERVLDSSPANSQERAAAMSSTLRLRQIVPPWPSTAQQRKIIIRAETAPRNAAILQPILDELCKELTDSSAGILRFDAEIRQTINPKSRKTIPSVSISMIGTLPGAARTESIKFTPSSPMALATDLRRNVYAMFRAKWAQNPETVPPSTWPKEDDAIANVFRNRITRLQWLELGVAMQRPPVIPKPVEDLPKKKKTR